MWNRLEKYVDLQSQKEVCQEFETGIINHTSAMRTKTKNTNGKDMEMVWEERQDNTSHA